MSKHFVGQIGKLKDMILSMAEVVEENVSEAARAIRKCDTDLALEVIFNDTRIDRLEIELEEECLHILALYQPVASDMRFVASVLTINKDLERIGDLAVNLAEQAIILSQEPFTGIAPFELAEQSQRVLTMLSQSLQALVEFDAERALSVLQADDEVDRIHREMYQQVKRRAKEDPDDASRAIDLLMVSRNLERIADHAVNIAEDVIYTVRGEVVRHNHARQLSPKSG